MEQARQGMVRQPPDSPLTSASWKSTASPVRLSEWASSAMGSHVFVSSSRTACQGSPGLSPNNDNISGHESMPSSLQITGGKELYYCIA